MLSKMILKYKHYIIKFFITTGLCAAMALGLFSFIQPQTSMAQVICALAPAAGCQDTRCDIARICNQICIDGDCRGVWPDVPVETAAIRTGTCGVWPGCALDCTGKKVIVEMSSGCNCSMNTPTTASCINNAGGSCSGRCLNW